MGKEDWFKTGEEGVEEAKKFDEDAARRRAEAMDENVVAKKRRFWLPPDKSAVISFLDSPQFFLREHQLFIGGSWQNYETSVLPGTRILTEEGAKAIEDIGIGERVLTHKGNFKPVVATSSHYTDKDTITLRCGKMLTPLPLTYDHKVFYVPQPKTGSGRTGRHREILESVSLTEGKAEDVQVGDYMFVPKIQIDQKEVEVISEDEAWLYGLYAANGSREGGTKKTIGICVTVSPNKRDVADRAFRILEDMGYLPVFKDKGNCFRVFARTPDGKGIGEKFVQLCGPSTFRKKVPDSVFYGTPEIAEAALQGIVDGDGYNHEALSSTSFVSTSFQLAMQGFQLALRTGRAPSFRYVEWKDDDTRHPFYNVYWSNQGRQFNSIVVDNGMFVKVLEKNREPYEGQVYDLTVKDDHSFTIDGVAVRNCLSDFDNCPLDEAGMKPSYVVAATVIDHTEFVLKRGPNAGTRVKDQKRLIVFKSTARLKILKQKERQNGDLTYCQFEATRYTAKECSTSEDFSYIKTLTPEEVMAFAPATVIGKSGQPEPVDPAEWIKPFNYPEVFKPKSADELRALVGGIAPVGSEKTPPINPPSGAAPEIGRLL